MNFFVVPERLRLAEDYIVTQDRTLALRRTINVLSQKRPKTEAPAALQGVSGLLPTGEIDYGNSAETDAYQWLYDDVLRTTGGDKDAAKHAVDAELTRPREQRIKELSKQVRILERTLRQMNRVGKLYAEREQLHRPR